MIGLRPQDLFSRPVSPADITTSVSLIVINHPCLTCWAHDVAVDVAACAQSAAHVFDHRGEHRLKVLLQHTMQLVGLAGGQAQRAIAKLHKHAGQATGAAAAAAAAGGRMPGAAGVV